MEEVRKFLKLHLKPTKEQYHQLSLLCHPDRVSESEKEEAAKLFGELKAIFTGTLAPLFEVAGWKAIKEIASGSVASVFETQTPNVCIKLSHSNAYNSLVENEFNTLSCINKNLIPVLRPLFVEPIDQKKVKGRSLTVLRFAGDITLDAYQDLDNRHIIWITKRVLSALSYLHSYGLVHGSISADHLLIDRQNHGVQLIDWCFAGKTGYKPKMVPSKTNRPTDSKYTSETDIYMLAQTMLAYSTENKLRNYFQCVCQSKQASRPSASMMFNEIVDIAYSLYGKPKFVNLT